MRPHRPVQASSARIPPQDLAAEGARLQEPCDWQCLAVSEISSAPSLAVPPTGLLSISPLLLSTQHLASSGPWLSPHWESAPSMPQLLFSALFQSVLVHYCPQVKEGPRHLPCASWGKESLSKMAGLAERILI